MVSGQLSSELQFPKLQNEYVNKLITGVIMLNYVAVMIETDETRVVEICDVKICFLFVNLNLQPLE